MAVQWRVGGSKFRSISIGGWEDTERFIETWERCGGRLLVPASGQSVRPSRFCNHDCEPNAQLSRSL